MDLPQPYQIGHWSGLLNGAPASVDRRRIGGHLPRFAVNLIGAPPLAGKEFAEYRAKADHETIVGMGLIVQFPTGQYYDDKLINLGDNGSRSAPSSAPSTTGASGRRNSPAKAGSSPTTTISTMASG